MYMHQYQSYMVLYRVFSYNVWRYWRSKDSCSRSDYCSCPVNIIYRIYLSKLSSLVTVDIVCWCGVWRRAGGTVQCWQAGQGRYQLTQAKHWQFPSPSLLRYITPAAGDNKQSIIHRSVIFRCGCWLLSKRRGLNKDLNLVGTSQCLLKTLQHCEIRE